MAEEQGEPVDLRESGLLWLINRVVFHPRGFALGYDEEEGSFVLIGDGTETWAFDRQTVDEDDLFARASETLRRRG